MGSARTTTPPQDRPPVVTAVTVAVTAVRAKRGRHHRSGRVRNAMQRAMQRATACTRQDQTAVIDWYAPTKIRDLCCAQTHQLVLEPLVLVCDWRRLAGPVALRPKHAPAGAVMSCHAQPGQVRVEVGKKNANDGRRQHAGQVRANIASVLMSTSLPHQRTRLRLLSTT